MVDRPSMVAAAKNRKTALKTMVCDTSGYFAILTAAQKVSLATVRLAIRNGLRFGEKHRFSLMTRTTRSNKPGRPTPDSRREAVLSAIIEEHLVTGDAIG